MLTLPSFKARMNQATAATLKSLNLWSPAADPEGWTQWPCPEKPLFRRLVAGRPPRQRSTAGHRL